MNDLSERSQYTSEEREILNIACNVIYGIYSKDEVKTAFYSEPNNTFCLKKTKDGMFTVFAKFDNRVKIYHTSDDIIDACKSLMVNIAYGEDDEDYLIEAFDNIVSANEYNPMDINETKMFNLTKIIALKNFDFDNYEFPRIDTSFVENGYSLSKHKNGYSVYYGENGIKSDLMYFNDMKNASLYLLRLILNYDKNALNKAQNEFINKYKNLDSNKANNR